MPRCASRNLDLFARIQIGPNLSRPCVSTTLARLQLHEGTSVRLPYHHCPMFARLSAFYARSFDRHPWLTLAVTNGGLSVVADACAQSFELYNTRRSSPEVPYEEKGMTPHQQPADPPAFARHQATLGLDPLRSARFLTFGAIMAPALDVWNKFLERRFPIVKAGRASFPLLLRRVAVDQVVFAPIGVAAFIGTISVLEGRSRAEIADKYHNMFSEALLANWKVWPLVQLINFRFMPLMYRVPFMSSCGVLWTIYLSLLNMSNPSKVPEPDLDAALIHP